jgi:hypothetical protein
MSNLSPVQAKKLEMVNNHFYHLLPAELYRSNDIGQAKLNLQEAYDLSKTDVEKRIIMEKMENIQPPY